MPKLGHDFRIDSGHHNFGQIIHIHYAHETDCLVCTNIVLTLDEIGEKIEGITDKDIHRKAEFDFENASEHIIEWLRYNLRATRQDAENKSITLQMGDDEIFCTFDWDQKLLPQEYHEIQSKSFRKTVCQYLPSCSCGETQRHDLQLQRSSLIIPPLPLILLNRTLLF